MRNPVGPLPSSIYWRRRVVALCLLALVALLVFWAVNSGGSGGGKGAQAPTGSHTPVTTITAGPAPTGSHISGRPGGRDTSGGDSDGSTSGSSAGTTSGSTGGGSAGTTQGGDTAGANSAAGASGSTDSGGGGGSSSGSGGQLPAGSTLPDCAPGSVQLALRSVSNSYAPDENPAFELRATNPGAVACKIDFGPAKAVFTITAASGNTHTWASDDCPAPGHGSYLLQVPAHSSTTYTQHWNDKTSSPHCATPKGQTAGPGTYLVSAQLPGYAAKQVSFVLSAD